MDAELAVDVVQVSVHRSGRDQHAVGDGGRGDAVGQEAEHRLRGRGRRVAVLGRAADDSGTRWAYQHSGRRRHVPTLRFVDVPIHSCGSRQRVAMLYYGPRLSARTLRVPSR
jgi:hypothetical protein